MSRIGKSIEANRIRGCRGWGMEREIREVTAKGHRVSFRVDESVLKLIVVMIRKLRLYSNKKVCWTF